MLALVLVFFCGENKYNKTLEAREGKMGVGYGGGAGVMANNVNSVFNLIPAGGAGSSQFYFKTSEHFAVLFRQN